MEGGTGANLFFWLFLVTQMTVFYNRSEERLRATEPQTDMMHDAMHTAHSLTVYE